MKPATRGMAARLAGVHITAYSRRENPCLHGVLARKAIPRDSVYCYIRANRSANMVKLRENDASANQAERYAPALRYMYTRAIRDEAQSARWRQAQAAVARWQPVRASGSGCWRNRELLLGVVVARLRAR